MEFQGQHPFNTHNVVTPVASAHYSPTSPPPSFRRRASAAPGFQGPTPSKRCARLGPPNNAQKGDGTLRFVCFFGGGGYEGRELVEVSRFGS